MQIFATKSKYFKLRFTEQLRLRGWRSLEHFRERVSVNNDNRRLDGGKGTGIIIVKGVIKLSEI